MRIISELSLKKTYESNSETVLALNMIPGLRFVPDSKVRIAFDLVIEKICFKTAIPQYIRFLKKFNCNPIIKNSIF